MALHPAARVHGVDGIFVDRWGLRIFLNVVFGAFPKRLAQEVENGVEAPQPKISLEGYSHQKCPWWTYSRDLHLLKDFDSVSRKMKRCHSGTISRHSVGVGVM
jgi:hypothetical protein